MKLLHLKVVLVAVESDESAIETLRSAAEFSRTAGAALNVVHVIPAGAGPSGQPVQADSSSSALRALLEHAEVSASDVQLHLLSGEPSHVIRSLADRLHADVIVLGKHRGRPAALRHHMGSTALGVVTNSWAPCLILAGAMRLPLERVVVPVDLSDTSRGALAVALSWASALRPTKRAAEGTSEHRVSLRALLVERPNSPRVDLSGQARALDEQLERLQQDAGKWAHVAIERAVVANSDVPSAIADYANDEQADLIVLGTRGLGLDATGRLGSVSLGVGRRVAIPLLLVPPAVWSSYASTA